MSENSEIPSTKSELRAWARSRPRLADLSALSAAVATQIEALPEFESARRVLLYLAMPHEIDIEYVATADGTATKSWYAPRCAPQKQLAIHEFLPDSTVLKIGAYGIREPDPLLSPQVSPDLLDLVFVPGLLFTRDGVRLGNGGGYYDRFLSRLAPSCLVVGVATSDQIVDRIPCDTWDVRIPLLVTESEIIRTQESAQI